MLTLKNICKTYHTKGGVDVKALDNVSLTFPETGMVFLLGKSGSGKSTLLNVCGGLDSADSGEIIICGRSSATFSGSDFDSYRNTFVGFIFQEYNILNEFTVEENLALALELQGKGKNKEKVAELLKQVDLEGFAKRKPNTLSGGQKQRIAIARALIKEPKIIMADEPTGALDSNTGRQVLDTLKKLSATRLVIIVSHDREFAEIYGDRVIELKDGQVISDVSKKSFAAEKMGENISVIAGETLSVKNGKDLTESDMKKIREYIEGADGDIIISRSKNDITSFKKVNRIAEDDSSEHFETTNVSVIPTREYSAAESALVRSKLPMSKALKMGASSLKVKKFRLVLTVFLSVVAFIMFGIFSTLMTYNGDNVLINSYPQSYYDTIDLAKTYEITQTYYKSGEILNTYTYDVTTNFTESDIAALRESIGSDVYGIMQLASGSSKVYNVSTDTANSRALTASSIKGVTCAPEGSSFKTMLAGTYPSANDEIAISEWYYEMLKAQTFYSVSDDEGTYKLGSKIVVQTMDDVLGQYLCLNIRSNYSNVYAYYKITGVYDGGEIPSDFSGWNDAERCASWDEDLLNSYENYLDESMHCVVLVSDTFCSAFVEENGIYTYTYNYDSEKYFTETDYYYDKNIGLYTYSANAYNAADENMLDVYWFGGQKTSLSGNECIIDISNLREFIYYSLSYVDDETSTLWQESYTEKYGALIEDAYDQSYNYYNLYVKEMDKQTPDEAQAAKYYEQYEYYNTIAQKYEILININNVFSLSYSITESTDDSAIYLEAIVDYIENYCPVSLTVDLYDYADNKITYTIVGFHEYAGDEYYDGYYVSQSVYDSIKSSYYSITTTDYVEPDNAIYRYAYVKYDGSQSTISDIVDLINVKNADGSSVAINGELYSSIEMINELVSILSSVFLYAGIVFAAFAALLLFNFISVSITNKTHEIGVLRAVGARGWDVFKIFFAEAAIITLICLVISLIGTAVLVSYLNSVLSAGLGFPYVLFSFGIISLLMMLGVSVIVAVLGTFIPVFRISRKKPVDSMRTL